MIEIVFGESACGSLKIAQTYGKGKYRGSAVSIFMRHEDGSVPSSDEMKKAQLQAQEQERIAWENAIPLGGKSSDVYCFDMALSVGDISDNGIGEQRKNVLKKMLSVWFVEDLDYQVEEKIQKIKTTLSSVIELSLIHICRGFSEVAPGKADRRTHFNQTVINAGVGGVLRVGLSIMKSAICETQ